MGFKEKARQQEKDHERIRMELETDYSRWQQAAFRVIQTIDQYITSDPELRGRLRFEIHDRHITDPFLKSRKQLDKMIIFLKSDPKQSISILPLPLWPRTKGEPGRVELKSSLPRDSEYYLTWDGKGESPNNWRIRSSGGLDKRLNPESLDEVLGEVFALQ